MTVTAPAQIITAPAVTAPAQTITAPAITLDPVTITATEPAVTETVEHTLAPVVRTSIVKQTVRVTPAPVTVNYTATVVQTPDAQTVTAQPPAAAAAFSDGTELVGTDVQPGTYRAPGGSSCYWERLKGASGSTDDIIANDVDTVNPVVTISSDDFAFTSSNCGGWSKIG